MKYREIYHADLLEASCLIWKVFSEFVAPGYSEEGIETFREFITPEELKTLLDTGKFLMLGCFEEEKLLGIIAMRDLCHVSLLFVDKAYHGRGIAKELFRKAVELCIMKNPELKEITVNSSPFAVEIYKKIGFENNGEETTTNGITYVPMKMCLTSTNKNGELIRYIKKNELKELLELYKHLVDDDPELQDNESLGALWEEILNDPSQHYIVTEVDGRIVSSCVLVIIKNLTRGARPYGLIENVVTHKDYRNKGYGTRLLQRAQQIAGNKGCYKVMLLTGRGEETLKFYEKAGFKRGIKTGLIVKL